MVTYYNLSTDVLTHLGPITSVIHAIIAKHEGMCLTYKEIHELANASVSSVRRSIQELVDHGYIRTTQVVDPKGCIQGNQYTLVANQDDPSQDEQTPPPCSDRTDPPVLTEQIITTSNTSISSSNTYRERKKNKEIVGKLPGSEGQRPSSSWDPTQRTNPSRLDQALVLVDHLYGYVLAQENKNRLDHGWKTTETVRNSEARRLAWGKTALDLLGIAELDEITDMITWLFERRYGFLPWTPLDYFTGKPDPQARKVTNLNQIRYGWDRLKKHHANSSEEIKVFPINTGNELADRFAKCFD